MRLLLIQVPQGQGNRVLELARAYEALNFATFEARGEESPVDMAVVHVANNKVEALLADLQQLPDLKLTLIPRGVITLQPPASAAPQQVIDVNPRSPIEIFLGALQSIGSWKGYLGYALAASFVVWIGLFTNTTYLLTAAMLIAPYAGPAMNTAIATARGDWELLYRSQLRYFAALTLTVIIAALLSIVFGQEIATSLMISTSELSSVAVLLPLVAGAAGALNLVQSQRNSLVAGAAVGMLISVSLAPPASLIGMATVLGEWSMVKAGLFVLFQTLAGINLAGAIVFYLYGLTPKGVRYERGQVWIAVTAFLGTLVLLAGLTTWQLWSQPELQHASRAQRAAAEVQKLVNQTGYASLVETNVRFTRANIQGQNTLLVVVYVQRDPESALSAEKMRQDLTQSIQETLLAKEFDVLPLVDVNVLEPP